MTLYSTTAELDFALAELAPLSAPDHILMADPAEFDVLYAINAHMRGADGALLKVDREEARRQWWCLREALEDLGLHVDVLAPLEGQPDLVFCANQCLPIPLEVTGGAPIALASQMANAERATEVPHVISFMRELGYQPAALKRRDVRFEGMGDGLWHPGRQLLWAGIGPRSAPEAWAEISQRYNVPVITLELADPDFYHLDTALAVLNETTCLWCPAAFDDAGRALIQAVFTTCIEAPETEARRGFACNALCPDGRHVLIQKGNPITKQRLIDAGLDVIELDTSEFMKSGGSVFCMKLLHGPL